MKIMDYMQLTHNDPNHPTQHHTPSPQHVRVCVSSRVALGNAWLVCDDQLQKESKNP